MLGELSLTILFSDLHADHASPGILALSPMTLPTMPSACLAVFLRAVLLTPASPRLMLPNATCRYALSTFHSNPMPHLVY
jgi:hypothetical protein